MEHRVIGPDGPPVSEMALGCMAMSGSYGPADEHEGEATIQAAVDAGLTLLDTGDFYGAGHNELLIGRALAGGRRDQVALSVKFGGLRGPDGSWSGYDARPAAVRNFLAYSLQRLRTDHVDIYRPARLDPAVPIEETVGAVSEMVAAGYVRHVGLSEVGPETIRRAHAVHPVHDVQVEYSVLSRGPERGILPTCRELGIGVTAYGVLSRGLLSGHWSPGRQAAPGDFRAHAPRFQPDNLARNLELVEALRQLAEPRGMTVAQLAIAWVLAQGPGVVALVGPRSRAQLAEALSAVGLRLDADTLAAIEQAVPPGSAAGDRYAGPQMAMLDSER